MGFLLNQSTHSHSHCPSETRGAPGHAHGSGTLAVRAAFIHALGDMMQSIGVLMAAYIIRFEVRLTFFCCKLYNPVHCMVP